jgi:hypothetical protein
VNGTEINPIEPGPDNFYLWYTLPIPVSILKEGANTVEIWTDSTAMNAWSLALESGQTNTQSAISDDGGTTWRQERMGYLNAVRAEYVIRIRLAEGEDPEPPAIRWEDPGHPRLVSLRQAIPAKVKKDGSLLERVLALSTWMSQSWEHTGSGRAAVVYAPWDAETILAWGEQRSGHNGERAVVMCVHYAVAFVTACQALNIPARCAVLMGTPNGTDGHFVSEVWFEEYGKWVMVDPNSDAIFINQDIPMSISEIQKAGSDLSNLVQWGPGSDFQRTFRHMAAFVKDNLLKGICFRHRSLWPYMNLLSVPSLSPPGHGSVSYCETDLVWSSAYRNQGFGMFQYFADEAYFDAPPKR